MRRHLAALVVLVVVAACGGSGGDDAAPTSTTAPRTSSTVAEDPAGADAERTDPSVDDPMLDDALSSDAAPGWILTSEPLANAAGTPRLLVSDGDAVVRVDGAVAVTLADAGALAPVAGPGAAFGSVVGDGAGLVVAEVLAADAGGVVEQRSLVRVVGDGVEPLSLAENLAVSLLDLTVVGGDPHLVYALFQNPTESDSETGTLRVRDLEAGTTRSIAPAAGPDRLLRTASAVTDRITLGTLVGGVGTVEVIDLDGNPVTASFPAGSLPTSTETVEVSAPVLSPDGSELAHLEGPRPIEPDSDDAAGIAVAGDWQVVIDDADGEQLRLTVADGALSGLRLDFDGRWLLVSATGPDGPLSPLLIDSEATDLATYLVDVATGVATLESAAGR